ncbi:MAG TPA: glycosyltransferase family 4 protein [Vicinamibacteria bacterium]
MIEDPGGPGRWFPPQRGPVLVIGNPGNLFPQHLAALWRSMGLDARILTRRPYGGPVHLAGVPVTVTSETEGRSLGRAWGGIERAAWLFESRLVAAQQDRYRRAMGSETSYRPYVSPALADAAALSHVVRKMKPEFVCGQEVFSYGLATAFCWNVPRILMPWGGDVYMYGHTTSLAFAAVRYALNHVDLVVPGSPLARDYLHETFGVPMERMHCGGLWALDRALSHPARPSDRARICARYGIDPAALVVMNVRRFFPAWGCDLALEAFRRFARQCASAHFVMLGGGGTEAHVSRAREVVEGDGLRGRFTFFAGDVPVDECRDLMKVSEVFVSLMRERDMRPLASILEATACGAAPVLGDQPEYRAMEQMGYRAIFCPTEDVEAVVEGLRRYADDPVLRRETSAANQAYLDAHEDGRGQAIDLLARIRSICDARARA